MYNLLEKLFIPSYGAGIISNIEDRKVFDKYRKYYIISLMLDSMSLYIPENKIKDYRIRKISSPEVIESCIISAKDNPLNFEKRWNKRYRENNDKIASGAIEEECEALRELYYIKNQGIMPPGEQKILDKIEGMLASEIALSFNISLEEAYKKLQQLS